MDLDCLTALDALAEHGTMAAAAAALHLSPSAVSQQLARLQDDVGEELLARRGRGVRLTDAGAVLAAHARDLRERVERARAEVQAAAGQVRGHVVIGAFASGSRGVVVPALVGLGSYPQLTVELREAEMDVALPALARGEIDVVVANDWDTDPLRLDPGVEHAVLARDQLDVVMRRDHPMAAGPNLTLAAVGADPWIAWTRDSICYRWLLGTLRQEGFTPRIAHTAEEHATQLALVRAGAGHALLPRIGREELPADVVARPLDPPLGRRVYALWRAEAGSRPAVRAVVAALGEAATPTPDTRRGRAERADPPPR